MTEPERTTDALWIYYTAHGCVVYCIIQLCHIILGVSDFFFFSFLMRMSCEEWVNKHTPRLVFPLDTAHWLKLLHLYQHSY